MRNRRGEILDAALRLFAERGYTHTSVEDVIAAAALSGKSHFYHYFKSKEELAYAALDRLVARLGERAAALLRDSTVDPLERLDLFIDAIVALLTERGVAGGSPFGSLAVEAAPSHEGFRARLGAAFERWAAQIEALLAEARPRLEPGVDTARIARFAVAALEGAMLMARVTREAGVVQGVAADLKRFIRTHVREQARERGREGALAPSLAPALARSAADAEGGAAEAARAAGEQRLASVAGSLQARAGADGPVHKALDTYIAAATGGSDADQVHAANKAALEAVAIGQQVLAGQFWTDPAFQTAYRTALASL
jgi:TetR/AcrR family transcriptional repressor of nem operon